MVEMVQILNKTQRIFGFNSNLMIFYLFFFKFGPGPAASAIFVGLDSGSGYGLRVRRLHEKRVVRVFFIVVRIVSVCCRLLFSLVRIRLASVVKTSHIELEVNSRVGLPKQITCGRVGGSGNGLAGE
jgi:hypothetical protein